MKNFFISSQAVKSVSHTYYFNQLLVNSVKKFSLIADLDLIQWVCEKCTSNQNGNYGAFIAALDLCVKKHI